MITTEKFYNDDYEYRAHAVFNGLSTDTKPTAGVPNGSVFVEVDTGYVYRFDAEHSTWYKSSSGGGGGGGETDPDWDPI